MGARHRISKLLLRRGLVFDGPGETWSRHHLAWLSKIRFKQPLVEVVFAEYLAHHEVLLARPDRLDSLLLEQSVQGPWAPTVARLRCLRGVDTLTAVGLVAEIGDVTAFKHPKQLSSYLGLVPSEHSSGERRRQGSITKAGSTHAYALGWSEDLRGFLGELLAAVTLALVALLKNAEKRAAHAVQYKLDTIARALLETRRGTDDGAEKDFKRRSGATRTSEFPPASWAFRCPSSGANGSGAGDLSGCQCRDRQSFPKQAACASEPYRQLTPAERVERGNGAVPDLDRSRRTRADVMRFVTSSRARS